MLPIDQMLRSLMNVNLWYISYVHILFFFTFLQHVHEFESRMYIDTYLFAHHRVYIVCNGKQASVKIIDSVVRASILGMIQT